MVLFFITLSLGIIAALAFLYIRVKKGGVPGLIAKAFASVTFVLTAIAATALCDAYAVSNYCLFIIFGLVLGMLGDIWLDLKWVYPNDNDVYTFAGMGSFGIGHIFYIFALYLLSPMLADSWAYFYGAMLIALALGTGTILLEKKMKMEYGRFKWISLAYGGILSFMMLASLGACISSGWHPVFIMMFIGSIFFLASDAILSGMYFDKEKAKNTPFNVIINHATYYIAQFLIASSIIFLV